MITQACPSLNCVLSWGPRGPEWRVSHTALSHAIPSTLSHDQSQTCMKKRPAGPTHCSASIDARGCRGPRVTWRGRKVLPSRVPAGSTCRGSRPGQNLTPTFPPHPLAQGPESDTTHLSSGEVSRTKLGQGHRDPCSGPRASVADHKWEPGPSLPSLSW